MATVIITFEDIEGDVNLSIEMDPQIPLDTRQATDAQLLALAAYGYCTKMTTTVVEPRIISVDGVPTGD